MASKRTADWASSPRPKSATTLEMSSTAGMLPSSATRQEAVPKRKSPTRVAARSPCRTCAVSSPRRKSAPSRMSSCTREAECSTSMLAANLITRLRLASGASNALPTRSTREGLNRLPPDWKSLSTALRTSSLSAASAKVVSSSILLTLIISRPMQRMEPSSAALGPPFGQAGAGTMESAGRGSLLSPAAMSASISRSPALSRVKPSPDTTSTFSPSAVSGNGYRSERLVRSSSNSLKLRPVTLLRSSARRSLAMEAAQERSTRWARRLIPRTAAAAEPLPRPSKASRADRASHRAQSCEATSSCCCASFSAHPKSEP
mmetsp:Transcript_97516/g.271297  ORF Transcript_97516/g.271297 Transcript_97516/m.271297 type:complete len:318 (-) Transcript_97516:652-1605(-)